jgi:hypothetical protein
MVSRFRETLLFFEKLGIYDVILPFLLVFTIVFAILEKTKIFGTEDIDGKKYTRKNLNSMIAFVSAFLVVASTKLVAIINETVANVVLLLILGVCFLMLAGSFHSGDKEFFLDKKWATFFMILMFAGIVLIFANAVKIEDDKSVLQWIWEKVFLNWDTTAVSSVILLVLVIGVMVFVSMGGAKPKEKKEE